MHILAIPGSLRAQSSNRTLLEAGAAIAPDGMTIALYDGLAQLPHFNPDDDRQPAPPAVGFWRDAVAGADGLLISSPEYARGVPGSLKNALDWLVSDTRLYGKPMALWHTAPDTRGGAAKAQLELILTTLSGRIIKAASVTAPIQGSALATVDLIADDAVKSRLERALSAFAAAIETGAGQ